MIFCFKENYNYTQFTHKMKNQQSERKTKLPKERVSILKTHTRTHSHTISPILAKHARSLIAHTHILLYIQSFTQSQNETRR